MKASERDGSDVPKIIINNTLGYKSPGWKEQTQDIIIDKDEGAYTWMKNRASWLCESERSRGAKGELDAMRTLLIADMEIEVCYKKAL